ncbi:MAG: DUF6452 family protein [Cyclobacteriaceae bacterium]|nr:DUF6452 family protein [Cyclobacteriaceae bacterium]
MKRFKIYVSLSLCLLVCLFSGCGCHPEFNGLTVVFRNSGFTKMKRLGASNYIVDKTKKEMYFNLNFDLTSDKVSYIFIDEARQDTLSIAYTAQFKFKSKQCGYVQSIENIKVVPPTSFKLTKINLNFITVDD